MPRDRKRWILTVVAAIAVGFFGIAASAQSGTDVARDQIKKFLAQVFSQVPDEALLQEGIASEHINAAKTCSVQAIMADIPDDAVMRIAPMLRQSPVPRDKLIEHWLLPDLSTDVERRQQINAQVAKICPEFREQLQVY